MSNRVVFGNCVVYDKQHSAYLGNGQSKVAYDRVSNLSEATIFDTSTNVKRWLTSTYPKEIDRFVIQEIRPTLTGVNLTYMGPEKQ